MHRLSDKHGQNRRCNVARGTSSVETSKVLLRRPIGCYDEIFCDVPSRGLDLLTLIGIEEHGGDEVWWNDEFGGRKS